MVLVSESLKFEIMRLRENFSFYEPFDTSLMWGSTEKSVSGYCVFPDLQQISSVMIMEWRFIIKIWEQLLTKLYAIQNNWKHNK